MFNLNFGWHLEDGQMEATFSSEAFSENFCASLRSLGFQSSKVLWTAHGLHCWARLKNVFMARQESKQSHQK